MTHLDDLARMDGKSSLKVALTAGGPGVGVGAMQRELYRCVHDWREKLAREDDRNTK